MNDPESFKPGENADGEPEVIAEESTTAAAEEVSTEEPETNWEAVAEERYDQLVRLRADFENFRRRQDREREDIRGFVMATVLSDFLGIYDNLDRALKAMPTDDAAKSWRVGIEMTMKGFNEAFMRQGVEAIETEGQMFDPRWHEAIQQVPSDLPEGTIVEELAKGFRYKERVLRASMVRVSEGPSESVSEDA